MKPTSADSPVDRYRASSRVYPDQYSNPQQIVEGISRLFSGDKLLVKHKPGFLKTSGSPAGGLDGSYALIQRASI
jgi:hypothetical protein